MNTKGAIPVVLIVMLTACGVGSVWLKPWEWGKSKPDTAPISQLAQAQKDRDQAKSELITADANYKTALKADHDKQVSQTQYSQQMLSGAQMAFKTIPSASLPPAYTFGLSLLDRASNGLEKAIGDLPQDKQDEIRQIVDGALSQAQSRIDEANKELAAKDSQLIATTSERDTLRGQIPGLKSTLDAKTDAYNSANSLVDQKTAQVVQIAKDKDQVTSLWAKAEASAKLFVEILIGIGCAYIFLAFILPTFGTAIGPLAEKICHEISGHLLSPLTHIKLKQTVAALTKTS